MGDRDFSDENEVGESIPPLTVHAVSVSLPTWKANVGYEEGEDWVLNKMKTGYPRFFIHLSIQHFARDILTKYGLPGQSAILFPSHKIAQRCVEFFLMASSSIPANQLQILDLVSKPNPSEAESTNVVSPNLSAVLFPEEHFVIAKQFWQHSGDGISSRRAEYCRALFQDGVLVSKQDLEPEAKLCKGPRRYRRKISVTSRQQPDGSDTQDPNRTEEDQSHYIEERFGRNLELSFSSNAKLAIKRRIAGSLTADVDLKDALRPGQDESKKRPVCGFSDDDVYVYPSGMSAIFNTHRSLMAARGQFKSISYGFPYIDTLKILEKFGPGCLFYGHGSAQDLDDLEERLKNGERFLALFCEFPGNPLLKSPDLVRIRQLADQFDFAIVIDETIGNFLNVHVLPYADVVVSSLTKIFSGDSNVMGGSAILNPKRQHYSALKKIWQQEYEDNYWVEDSIFMERNSRDFVSRVERINRNAEAICELLRSHPKVKNIYYPKYCSTRPFYDRCRTSTGGYGGLVSATFFSHDDAVTFFDTLQTSKGPSLGTNFTLSSPYVILAHYTELPWAASFGVESDLIRFSVGLEETQQLLRSFSVALEAISRE